MKTLEEYIEESLFKHIAIELKNEDIIYEKYGEYEGCYELAKYIANKLNENKSDIDIYYDDVKDIDNIVFDHLHINYSNIGNYGDYVVEKTGELSSTNRISYVEMNIYDDLKNHQRIISIIEHELTHIFNDYKLYQKGLKTFLDLFSNVAYERSKEFNSDRYKFSVREFKRAIYLLNEYEKNAFIAQLCSEIRELKKSYQNSNYIDANKMYDMIKDLDIWKAYFEIGKFIVRYNEGKMSIKDQNYIVDEWKQMYDEDITIDKIFKKLEKKFIKTKNKIESIVVKKIAEEHNINKIVMDGIDITDLRLK